MKKIIIIIVLLVIAALGFYKVSEKNEGDPVRSEEYSSAAEGYKQQVLTYNKNREMDVRLQGKSFGGYYKAYLSNDLSVMLSESFLEDVTGCSIIRYNDGSIRMDRGENTIVMKLGETDVNINSETVTSEAAPVVTMDGELYIPMDNISDYLDLEYKYDYIENFVDIRQVRKGQVLPEKYDLRDTGRVTPVRDQGRFGTCWAFASLGALETTLMPKEEQCYSTEHMTLNNSYNLDLSTGGEHTVSIAYLAAWQGPVYEKDDPYGDGISSRGLKAVKHLEEAIVVKNRNDDTIKTAIFRYGGVETSLYLQMDYTGEASDYYNEETAAYYYDEEKSPNHDIVIVGWDDNYPKENFTIEPEGNGAFICKNSWGEEFGDDGYFYVSYFDNVICNKSVVYTRVGDSDNFDKIYQSDMLGWVGLMGFNKENAYFANVYETDENEELAAVSFYATDKNTSFEVYLVQNFKDESSFENRELLTSGSMKYAGYYTVRIPEPVRLSDKSKYAVVVKIHTPNAIHPIAIEYNVDERTENFDITDGEGYISLYGEIWHNAEKTQNCNVCLKAFTNYVSDGGEDEIDKE